MARPSRREEVVEAAAAARIFYFIFHGLVNFILLAYDDRLSIQLRSGYYTEAVCYTLITVVTGWLFVTCGNRPGVVVQESNEVELQRQRDDAKLWMDAYGEEEGEQEEKGGKEEEMGRWDGEGGGGGTELMSKKKKSGDTLDTEVDKSNDIFDEEAGHGGINSKSVDKHSREEADKYEQPPLHFCHKCNIVQGYRTRHCKSCDTCIAKFDHHCFWIGKLILFRQLCWRTKSSKILGHACVHGYRVRLDQLLRK